MIEEQQKIKKIKRMAIPVSIKQLEWAHSLARKAGYRSLSAFVIALIKDYYEQNKGG